MSSLRYPEPPLPTSPLEVVFHVVLKGRVVWTPATPERIFQSITEMYRREHGIAFVSWLHRHGLYNDEEYRFYVNRCRLRRRYASSRERLRQKRKH